MEKSINEKLEIALKQLEIELGETETHTRNKPGPIPKGRKRTSIMLHPVAKEKLRKAAEAKGSSMSDIINVLIIHFLD